MPRTGRYRSSARFYDLISAEWPVYRAGRVAAIDLMALRPGHHVLDIGCGTGLNFPLLQNRIGPSGSITAVKCKADHAELMDALEDIRESAVTQINAQIAQTNDPQRVEALTAMRERAWDEEEAHRGRAQQTYFDCLNAARPGN